MAQSLTYWITRDADTDGRLLPFVCLWRERPSWCPAGKGGGWRNGPEGLQGFVCSLWPRECDDEFGVVPKSVRSVIRVVRRLPVEWDEHPRE